MTHQEKLNAHHAVWCKNLTICRRISVASLVILVLTFIRALLAAAQFTIIRKVKIYHAQNLIEDFMFKLGFSGQKSQEVKLLIERVTDGEYGQGEWFPVLVGACSYVVMRKDQKMFPIIEVADIVGCDVYELGRMISRVVDFAGLKLPEFDIANAFERAIKSNPSFGTVSEDLVKRMLQQEVFLVQCLIKWFVTTGRRPMPVVAAVLVFVAELNQVNVKIDDVAMELHVATATCR